MHRTTLVALAAASAPVAGPALAQQDMDFSKVAVRDMLVTSPDRIQKLFNEGESEQEPVAARRLADLIAKWAADEDRGNNWVRMV